MKINIQYGTNAVLFENESEIQTLTHKYILVYILVCSSFHPENVFNNCIKEVISIYFDYVGTNAKFIIMGFQANIIQAQEY